MDLKKLSQIYDGKRPHVPCNIDQDDNTGKPRISRRPKRDALDAFFKDTTIDKSKRITDAAQEKIEHQGKLLQKYKDDLAKAQEKISALQKSLKEKIDESPSVEEFFKEQLDEKDATIRTLTEALKKLQEEPIPSFDYDILTEELIVGDYKTFLDPSLAKIVLEILTNIPNTKLRTNYMVKDSLSHAQSQDLQSFIKAIELAMDGDLKPISEFDISGLPTDILPFAQSVKEGKPWISKEVYKEYAPIIKSYLASEDIKFPSLALLADSKKA